MLGILAGLLRTRSLDPRVSPVHVAPVILHGADFTEFYIAGRVFASGILPQYL